MIPAPARPAAGEPNAATPAGLLADGRWIGPHGIGRFAGEVLSRLPEASLLPSTLRLLHPLEPLWLHRVLRRLRPRLYFTPGFNPPLMSPVPVVMTLYDLIHLRVPEERTVVKRAYYALVVRDAARRGARILTPSRFTRGEILDWMGLPESQVTVVGAGVAASFTATGPRHEPGYPYMLYVGNHKPHKNLSRLLQAFARLPRAWGVRLLVTGDMDAALAVPARRCGMHDRLVTLGSVSEAELPAYYRGARAFLLPSLYEGFGLTAVEAMACGTPVLAGSTTALPEVVGDAALLVDPTDVLALAAGMARLLEDESLRSRLATSGAARARAFSWDDTATRVRTVLDEAAGA